MVYTVPGDNMRGFKEEKKRGSIGYPFEKYNIISQNSRQFATNHWHSETEIVFVKSGGIFININGNEFVGKAGDIFIVNSGEMHEIYGKESPLSYTAFVFDAEMLRFKTDVSDIFYKARFINKPENIGETFSLLEFIDSINEEKSECFEILTRTALLQFFALMMKEKKIVAEGKESGENGKNKMLKDIVLYIEENFAGEISLLQIAKQFNMSHKYFCRFFKNNFRKTFVEYLNDVRIEKAMRILADGVTVTESAVACGFNNMSYFTLVFKRKTGVTPSQYRKGKIHPMAPSYRDGSVPEQSF